MADQSSSETELLPAEQETSSDLRSQNSSGVALAYHRSGPLPDAREFHAYEKILQGAADRILTMAEKQANHRMEMERSVVAGGLSQMRWGLACASTLVLASLGLTGYIASLGQGLWGLAAVLTEIAAIGGAFVYSTKKNAEERVQKEKIREGVEEQEPKK